MLLETITNDIKSAMKSGDRFRVDTLRFLLAAIKKYEIDTYPPATGKTISEAEVLIVVQKQVKTHRESIDAFQKAGRSDLVEKESKELAILQTYVPQELTDTEISALVQKVKSGGATNFGQIMGQVMKEVAGRADGNKVAKIVKETLQ
jgi:uncharacterized protein YqeY